MPGCLKRTDHADSSQRRNGKRGFFKIGGYEKDFHVNPDAKDGNESSVKIHPPLPVKSSLQDRPM